MGISCNTAMFLASCADAHENIENVDFSKTLTLGRQFLNYLQKSVIKF